MAHTWSSRIDFAIDQSKLLSQPVRKKNMQSDELRALQAPFKEQYKSDPASAVVEMIATGQLDPEQITCHLESCTTDESGLHPAAGGPGNYACSGHLLLESLVACAGVTLCAVATAMGIKIVSGKVIAKGEIDFRGTLGVDRWRDL